VAPGVVAEAPAEGATGRGHDPLTDDETERALRIAVNRRLFHSSEGVDGDRGPQRLGVEPAEPEAGELDDPDVPRRRDVTQCNKWEQYAGNNPLRLRRRARPAG
jgi:hypothetical protein